MKIKLTSVFVDDQEKALRFYTEVLGFAKKADFSRGPFRWLTVASHEEQDGTELQLALNNNPAAEAAQHQLGFFCFSKLGVDFKVSWKSFGPYRLPVTSFSSYFMNG